MPKIVNTIQALASWLQYFTISEPLHHSFRFASKKLLNSPGRVIPFYTVKSDVKKAFSGGFKKLKYIGGA
jgi:hypothetical protein